MDYESSKHQMGAYSTSLQCSQYPPRLLHFNNYLLLIFMVCGVVVSAVSVRIFWGEGVGGIFVFFFCWGGGGGGGVVILCQIVMYNQ